MQGIIVAIKRTIKESDEAYILCRNGSCNNSKVSRELIVQIKYQQQKLNVEKCQRLYQTNFYQNKCGNAS